MKYIVHWEYCLEDQDKVTEKMVKSNEIREKDPEYFPKNLFPSQWTGHAKGFSIVEITDPAQFLNANMYWFPELKMKFVPCDDVATRMRLMLKSKK